MTVKLFHKAEQLPRIKERFRTSLVMSTILSAILCQLALEFAPTLQSTGHTIDAIMFVSNLVDDLAILLGILFFQIIVTKASRINFGVVDTIFSALYVIIAIIQVVNVLMLVRTGTSFDISLLSYLKSSNSGTVLSAVSALQSWKLYAFLLFCLIGIPLLSWITTRYFTISLHAILFANAPLFALSAIAYAAQPLQSPLSAERQANINPIYLSFKLFYSGSGPARALQGEYGAHNKKHSLPAPRAAANTKVSCCVSMNIVLITIDSVPYAAASRDHILSNPKQYPTLAGLYQRGMAFDKIYTTFPSSIQSLRSIIASVPPPVGSLESGLNSNSALSEPTLASELTNHGYSTAHFMSGELQFGGAHQYLSRQGFETIEDSSSLDCGKNGRATMVIYSHKGDDCTALASIDWLARQSHADSHRPFFLWAWFTNPHAPYFTQSHAFSAGPLNQEQHARALQETDTALGLLIDQLRRQGDLQSTIIMVVSDHGESFGKHGFRLHGTALIDEQVHIPMLLVAPGITEGVRSGLIGSSIDIAPTLLELSGFRAPTSWWGHSLLSPTHPNRAYFTKIAGGIALGIRRDRRKIIVSALDDHPYYFDIRNDPDERSALRLSASEEDSILQDVSAYARATRQADKPR